MKKKLALLLSAIMVVGMIPMTAFAATDARVSRVATGKIDAKVTDVNLIISNKDLNLVAAGDTFQLSLENAVWTNATETITIAMDGGGTGSGTLTRLTDTLAIVTYTKAAGANSVMTIPLNTTLKNGGQAKVTIDPEESVISAGTYVFANVVDGATTTTIEKLTDIQEKGSEIKSIVIKESVEGALKWGSTIQLKITNGFEFTDKGTVSVYPNITGLSIATTGDPAVLELTLPATGPSQAATIAINGIVVNFDSDDVDSGDIAEITLSGAGMTKTTIEVGTARDYGVTFTAENKTLPVFYSGRADKDTDSLKVTFAETIANSWLDNRKTTITFPDGVKVLEVAGIDIKKTENFSATTASGIFKIDQKARTSVLEFIATSDADKKGKVEMVFQLSVAPDFTGDIVATLGGAGVGEDMEVVIGTAVAPYTVEAETNEVNIDYREVTISDIIITEADTGLFEKGTTLAIGLDYISFDGKPSIEVVEGDIKIESIKTTGGRIEIEVKTATQKTPAVLKISDCKLFLQRNIPAGSYELSFLISATDGYDAKKEAFFQNYASNPAKTDNFKIDEVVILEDYVEVVTAGRDQDDSTFTTTIAVTIGADTLTAGKQTIALDVPAYISEGYTMLPVRAVTEALSGSAIVRWDDATKTVTITFGSRVISMTVGSKTMNINGVPVQMSKACEITDSRAFIPLRDLGYALGLNDSKINWDDATKTATLN